jgi:transcriptional regulator with XRE-family HTH domain
MEHPKVQADLKGLGACIRAQRRELGLTQTALGERTGWVQERISLLESGKYGMPSLPALSMLATALETPLENLLEAAGFQSLNNRESAQHSGVSTERKEPGDAIEQMQRLHQQNDRLVVGLTQLQEHLQHAQETIENAAHVRAQVAARRKELEEVLASVRRQEVKLD